ncbi:DEAD/DEAH box helicase [Plantibacter sp. Mn2098]|uniref:DEAD/DEAH box helicase n=1 Tax=Plantibacter sp. Mn2098 TaxID=3395266 RepID=UPI003BE9D76D
MRRTLRDWIVEAQTQQSAEDFQLQSSLNQLDFSDRRKMDLYFALVGEVFELIRSPTSAPRDYATVANALEIEARRLQGSAQNDAHFFSSVAFFMGGYSASAYLAMRQVRRNELTAPRSAACFDLMTRSALIADERVNAIVSSIRSGTSGIVTAFAEEEQEFANNAINEGPEAWISRYLFSKLLSRFAVTNLRAVLPQGDSPVWTPLVASFLDRRPPVWDFFPSQIQAIEAGLLSSPDTFSLQMPTGAGKTALMETLIFGHLVHKPEDLVILLVPFRALARELRTTLAGRLRQVGLNTRTIYGGAVPTDEERTNLDSLSVIIATPESFIGLLGAQPELLRRVTLVVCDEGHLLDADSRGIALELLLARVSRASSSPRIVFLSAIVPNIEEINSWLGGSPGTVVRSTSRPSEIEYAVLRGSGIGAKATVALELAELDTALSVHTLEYFLEPQDFRFVNPATGKTNTHKYQSVKARAIAAARKALTLGAVAVFTTTKSGNQGVVALAEELLLQLQLGLALPEPIAHAKDLEALHDARDYLQREFGANWIGTEMVKHAAVMHHGDIPQETREVLEDLLVAGRSPMVVCTSTLAEGVNLPLRTIVLNSVLRRTKDEEFPMLARDIKNLVGRVGRPGSSTRGLVICANPKQWDQIRPVATGQAGEPVAGALIRIVRELGTYLRTNDTNLENALLEGSPNFFPLVDGLDQTLIELMTEEIGQSEFEEAVGLLAASTYAATQAPADESELLVRVFRLRGSRMQEHRDSGRLAWFRETGASPRLFDSVAGGLRPQVEDWSSFTSPNDDRLLSAFLSWAFTRPEYTQAVDFAFRTTEDPHATEVSAIVGAWLRGDTYEGMAAAADLDINACLRVHAGVVLHTLVTLAEQAMVLLERLLEAESSVLGTPARMFSQHLLRGVKASDALELMNAGVRHRRAAIQLGAEPPSADAFQTLDVTARARASLEGSTHWLDDLGPLVLSQTRRDLGMPYMQP